MEFERCQEIMWLNLLTLQIKPVEKKLAYHVVIDHLDSRTGWHPEGLKTLDAKTSTTFYCLLTKIMSFSSFFF